MAEHHWTFIGIAYGLTAAVLVLEWLALRRARGRAIEAIRREREFDETPPA
jgi:hypothetical protein